jgi:hypothetical protein
MDINENDRLSNISEHLKMRAKQQHVCKEMNQYMINTNRKYFIAKKFFGPRYIGDDLFVWPRYIGDDFFLGTIFL